MKKVTLVLLALAMTLSVNLLAQKTKLKVGDKMPNFTLRNENGIEFNSIDYFNKQPLVIFFYPKNNAPVCTKQVCSFRDNFSKFDQLNAKVIGINPASLIFHRDFIYENELPYSILSDINGYVRRLFGVPTLFWSSKPKRYTFVINKSGIIKKIYYNKKDVHSHITEALKALN
jgi:peroxiredoxin Q/BCP